MMLKGLGHRLLVLAAVVWTAATLNFILPKLAPKNPIETKLLQEMETGGSLIDIKALVAQYEKLFALDRPLWEQYLLYMGNMLRLDLGYSISYYPARVADIIAAALPWTIGLTLAATLIAFFIGTLLGALTVWRGSGAWLRWSVPFLMVLSAIPYYLIGLVLVYFLAFVVPIFPLQGGYALTSVPTWSWSFLVEVVYHAFLPAMSMILAGAGSWALAMRGMMVTVQGEDYMLFAEARGLNPRRRFWSYGLRNAMLPQITALALHIGHVASGAILVELVFGYPGIGTTLLRAVEQSDFFVIYGVVFIIIVTIAIAMLLLDLLYPLLDPRIRRRAGA